MPASPAGAPAPPLDLLQWSNADFGALRSLLAQAYGDPEAVRDVFQRAVPRGEAGNAMIANVAWNSTALSTWKQVLEAARDAELLPELLSIVASDLSRLAYRKELLELCSRLQVETTVRVSGITLPPLWPKVLAGALGAGAFATAAHLLTPSTGERARTIASNSTPGASAPAPSSPKASEVVPPEPPPAELRFEGFAAPTKKGIYATLNVDLEAPVVADGVLLLPSAKPHTAIVLATRAPQLGPPTRLSADAKEIAAALEGLPEGLLQAAEEDTTLQPQARAVRVRNCVSKLAAELNAINAGDQKVCAQFRAARATLTRCKGLGAAVDTEGARVATVASSLSDRCR